MAAAPRRGRALGPQWVAGGSGPALRRRGPYRPGDRPRGPAQLAGSEAEDRRAGWAALGPAASSLACSSSRPALALRRQRRTPQPRRRCGSRFSLPVSCTGFFLLVTKTCAAAEHAQSCPLARPSRPGSAAPDLINYGPRKGGGARGRAWLSSSGNQRELQRRRAREWLGRSQREGALQAGRVRVGLAGGKRDV